MSQKPYFKNKFEKIINLLRFFAESRRLGIVDRIGLALSQESVREAIYEALRTIKALESRKITVVLEASGKEYSLTCCDYGKMENNVCVSGICGEVKKVVSGTGVNIGDKIWCARCPKIPDEEELTMFFESISDPLEGLRVAREVASLAMSYKIHREGGGD